MRKVIVIREVQNVILGGMRSDIHNGMKLAAKRRSVTMVKVYEEACEAYLDAQQQKIKETKKKVCIPE